MIPYQSRVALCCAALFISVLVTPDSFAQIRASELGTLTQVVDSTTISISYSRPSIRDRGTVFGGIVHWEDIWTPGANFATTFEFSKDVTIDTNPVPAGKYSIWMVVNPGDWEVILDPRHFRFHMERPERTDEQIRFMITPDTTASILETLTFTFPVARSTGALLRMHWGKTTVEMEIAVQPTRIYTISDDKAAPYLGDYRVKVEESEFGPAGTFEFELKHAEELLFGDMVIGVDGTIYTIVFAPAAEQIFNLGWCISGEIAGVVDIIFFEFEMDDSGQAVTFKARNPDDSLWMTGTRIDHGSD